jgi:tetratricopeptide (TPR) repeat protein
MEYLMSDLNFRKPPKTKNEIIKRQTEDQRRKDLATPEQIAKNAWSVRTGVKRTVVRAPEEYDIQIREDRIGRYFKKHLSRFIFAEFSKEYMAKGGMEELMTGVPIPLRKADLEVFAGGAGIKPNHLAANMAWIMGIDPHFQYTPQYVKFLNKVFNYKIMEGMLKTGRDAAEEGNYEEACIHFRATLCMNPEYLHGMYSYARCCREMYSASNNEEYIGRFKAESLDFFELTTEAHPRHAQSFYYLGYAYLNIGLYTKAQLAWNRFLGFTKSAKDRKEINNRLKQIKEPVIIEQAINEISAGRFAQGVDVLEHYLKSEFDNWWPLHYYLGLGYLNMGQRKDAVNAFKRALEKNGSHIDSMESLADIFKESGDKEEEQKYRKKIAIVKENQEEKAAYHDKKNSKVQPSTEDSIKRLTLEKDTTKKSKIKRLK